ncbi:uncharacterized protein LOC126742862 [Anthonomus grandis grandis]|uniref:uncharacterized protein LOC126742862 n=1 Tax=Anthonomus grandis grandis TaxID=2921223 RepID=UPI0021662AB8|nr:uncharacterized protein LOC126742862 [Anthonomus grandis grandis]
MLWVICKADTVQMKMKILKVNKKIHSLELIQVQILITILRPPLALQMMIQCPLLPAYMMAITLCMREIARMIENVQTYVWIPMDMNNALNMNEHSFPQSINVASQDCSSPLATFKLFIDKNVISLIVAETNS